MDDEQTPIRLEHLADVESPEVMRAALSRFRRRTLVRGIAFVAIVFLLPLIFRAAEDEPNTGDVLFFSDRTPIGRVVEGERATLIILEAIHIDEEHIDRVVNVPTFGMRNLLKIVASTDDLRPGEALEVTDQPGLVEWFDGHRRVRAVEAYIPFTGAAKTRTIYVLAVRNVEAPAVGPGSHTQRQCALPLNDAGVCEFTKKQGRVIESFTVEIDSLRIPERILEETDDDIPPGPPVGA